MQKRRELLFVFAAIEGVLSAFGAQKATDAMKLAASARSTAASIRAPRGP
jgi:hypothetical protein